MHKKSLVVGSGFGGLAVALRLRAQGHQVTILERCPDIGGRARCFKIEGYEFDAGPTVITAPYLFEDLFLLYGRHLKDYVDIKPLSPIWYRYQYQNGSTIDYGEKDFFLDQIAENFPKDVDNYRALYRKAEEIFYLGYENLADAPFHNFTFMLKQLPAIIKHKGLYSVYDFVSQHIHSENLRQALCTPPLLLGGDPRKSSAIYFLVHILEQKYGVHYAMGGTAKLVQALETLARENDIEIIYNKTVTHMETATTQIKAAHCDDGSIYKCDHIIYNGDAAHLYGTILAKHPQSLFTKIRTSIQSPSMGLLVIYFATKKRYSDIEHHTIGFGEDYGKILDNIFDVGNLGRDFSFYLHRPSATDPSCAPKNKDIFYALIPVPNLKTKIWTEQDYAHYVDYILEKLEKRLLPDLRHNIIARHHISPHYFKCELLSAHGSGFSLQPKLTQSAWFRYHNRDPYYENLYLAGASTHPGAGLPGVLNAAQLTAKLVT